MLGFVKEFTAFFLARKKYWLLPVLVMMIILGTLIVFTQGSVVAPFMYILGISAFHHDSAAALLRGDDIVAAVQEQRFTHKKHDSEFPHHAIAYCLAAAGISLGDVDHVVFHDKPGEYRVMGLAPYGEPKYAALKHEYRGAFDLA